ncbi:MAG: ribose-5-phosphate isomerase RpiA [Alkalibacterium gilvum]|uniref:Ribose-5-phosphate isomerase A n=1 Tax=Alkalibacterium gilvum TaxID=1130080 RepID=A0A1H6UMP9_9LACT|nr:MULTISPECIES: ribose-5-phosphate isomerase RpiA [Alkalibacterium]MDN6292987.1 ribose-5-phosphate isomerase RpiA [Alkalibacterium sp.]MDN6295215.1 ribose-5-phosphate isomerase RpiA [Alkalibacterium sp.]MDN6385606.1 ribose-5-phosphate isomerase RpiA [Alkalibacterium sp.]MDN6398624.1 ribose-5-phosphate isomerase RpiA [Alkalibacterium sp.]MDN6729655.1 ribose-5-phosphate isomerase RpiA [Alkalibacterium sp.]
MNLKEMVGNKAAEFVQDGTVVGLGTGSTAYYMIEAVGKRINEEGLSITGVTTSNRTADHAKKVGIPLKNINDVEKIDITIDGADEISDDYQGTKGGGGAHLFEKMVATHSDEVIWIVDDSKLVHKLGAFPLPIEVVTFGCQQVFRLFEEKNMKPSFRKDDKGDMYLTDSGNYIIDLHLEEINKPHELATWLNALTGVVEHGLFLDCVTKVIVGTEAGPEVKNVER